MRNIKYTKIIWPHSAGPMPEMELSLANNFVVRSCEVENDTAVVTLTEDEARQILRGRKLYCVAADRLGTLGLSHLMQLHRNTEKVREVPSTQPPSLWQRIRRSLFGR